MSNSDRNSNITNQTDKMCKEDWDKLELHLNLVDSFRYNNSTRRLYSYSSATNAKSRIDRIYITQSMTGQILNMQFENLDVSDHKMTRLKFKQAVVQGPGHYVFNNTLLNDPAFVSEIMNIFADFNDSNNMFSDNKILYDFLKMNICDHSKSF